MTDNKLSPNEELDFAYLLTLMPPLHKVPEFAWLPELFAIVGHERLINLCKYCGGETIQIPTLTQLTDSIEALQWFYTTKLVKRRSVEDVPMRLYPIYNEICNRYEGHDA